MNNMNDSDLEKLAKTFEENVENSSRTASINDLFTPSFMTRYTKFSSFKELLKAGQFNVNSLEEFNSLIGNSEFDDLIILTTQFQNWEEMQSTAVTEYFKK